MPDPLAIFRGASDQKRKMLLALWAELHASLASQLDDTRTARTVPCCLMPCAGLPSGQRPVAVGRPKRWGPPACADCVSRHTDRPGGWPLDLKEHRL